MNNKQTMDLFKKMAVARRNNRSGSIVSDDEIDNVGFARHESDTFIEESSNDSCDGNSLSLYGRRQSTGGQGCGSVSKMAVVTSNKFDDDEIFTAVAQAMINRYQNENMSEQEAILATVRGADELRAFIEALDQKYIICTSENTNETEISGDETFSEIVFNTRSLLNATLKALLSQNDLATEERGDGSKKYPDEMIAHDQDEYRKRHPKTPKNLRMSPMRTSSFNYSNHGFISQSESMDSACSEGSNSSMFRPFKRPRRWFFPQHKSERLVSQPFSLTASQVSPEKNKKRLTEMPLPKFHFDFGNKRNNSSKTSTFVFGDVARGQNSVQFDGTSVSNAVMGKKKGCTSIYAPPTSPICKVSSGIETNCCAAVAMS